MVYSHCTRIETGMRKKLGMGSMGSKIFTVRNNSSGKVMFSQASVILYRAGGCVRGKGGHAWWGMYMVGDVHGRRHAWQGEHAWWEGMCVRGVHGRRDGHCSGRYASHRNAFLFVKMFSLVRYRYRDSGSIVSYCANPIPCTASSPGLVQCQ